MFRALSLRSGQSGEDKQKAARPLEWGVRAQLWVISSLMEETESISTEK